MMPEMFCSANDCACSPDTAVVNASKIPMTYLSNSILNSTSGGSRQAALRRAPRSKRRAIGFIVLYQCLMWVARLRPGAGYADLPADIAGLERSASCIGEYRGAL